VKLPSLNVNEGICEGYYGTSREGEGMYERLNQFLKINFTLESYNNYAKIPKSIFKSLLRRNEFKKVSLFLKIFLSSQI